MKKVYEFCWSVKLMPIGVLTAIGVQLLLLSAGAMVPNPMFLLGLGIQVLLMALVVVGAYAFAMRRDVEKTHAFGIAEVRVEDVGGPTDGAVQKRLVGCCTCGWHADPEQGLPEADARAKPLARKAWEQHAAAHGAWRP